MFKVRLPFSRTSVAVTFVEPSLTQQHMRDECNIANIMRKYQAAGVSLPSVNPADFGDFSNFPDYVSALNSIARANEAFDALPSHLRKRFSNSPAEFLSFVSDESNVDEMRKLGLLKNVAENTVSASSMASSDADVSSSES